MLKDSYKYILHEMCNEHWELFIQCVQEIECLDEESAEELAENIMCNLK